MFFSLREKSFRVGKMAKANKTTLVMALTMLLIGMSALLLRSLIRGRRPNFLIDTVNTYASSKEGARTERVPFAVNNTTIKRFKISTGKQNVTNDYQEPTLSTNATNAMVKKSSNDSPFLVPGKVVIVTLTCDVKSCWSANKLFYETATKTISNQHQFSSIKQLKCKMGEFAAAEEKLNTSSGTPPPCYYTSSESFLSLPYLEKNRDALKIYLAIFKELLSSLLLMSKQETEVLTREKLVDQLLFLEKSIKSVIFDLDKAVQDLSACSCSQQNDKSTSSKVYTQSYQHLASKFSHSKSAFVTLKQLEIMYKVMKSDFWQRQSKFIFAC